MIRMFLIATLVAFGTVTANAQDRANLTWSAIYAGQVRMEGSRAPVAAPVPTPRPAGAAVEMVHRAAARHGVPVRLAVAVAHIESGFRCNARGAAGELGPLQIKPATARGLGYRGPVHALQSCGAGLEWGMRHLAVAYRRCGTKAGAARLHNRGLAASCHGGGAYVARVLRRV